MEKDSSKPQLVKATSWQNQNITKIIRFFKSHTLMIHEVTDLQWYRSFPFKTHFDTFLVKKKKKDKKDFLKLSEGVFFFFLETTVWSISTANLCHLTRETHLNWWGMAGYASWQHLPLLAGCSGLQVAGALDVTCRALLWITCQMLTHIWSCSAVYAAVESAVLHAAAFQEYWDSHD